MAEQSISAGTKKKRRRRMRLPNGIGSVHLIGDGKSRRNPWRARVPAHIEVDEVMGTATQKYITIGYFPTEADAIEALMEYRKSPYTIEAATCTFADIYEMWKVRKYPELSKSGRSSYSTAFKNSAPLHNMKMRDIRSFHMESIILNIKGGFQTQSLLKTFWGQIFKYAIEHDICQKNYAEFVKLRDKAPETKRTAIPAEHREKIWQEIDAGNPDAEIAMMLIYTGMRPSELLQLEKANIDLDKRIMIGGLKTESGKNRRIPIHRCILPFVARLMETPGEYLVMRYDKAEPKMITYEHFRDKHWLPLVEKLKMTEYTMHYGRHTCATMMREVGIEDDLRKLILGHKNDDITDRYTHHPDSMLLAAIDKLPGR